MTSYFSKKGLWSGSLERGSSTASAQGWGPPPPLCLLWLLPSLLPPQKQSDHYFFPPLDPLQELIHALVIAKDSLQEESAWRGKGIWGIWDIQFHLSFPFGWEGSKKEEPRNDGEREPWNDSEKNKFLQRALITMDTYYNGYLLRHVLITTSTYYAGPYYNGYLLRGS